MALSSDQLVALSEITRESYDTVESAASDLNTAQESVLSDDLDTWESIRDSHVKLAGGGDGVDFDDERKRAAIYYRVRNMLGLEYIDFYLEGGFQVLDLEVGANFG